MKQQLLLISICVILSSCSLYISEGKDALLSRAFTIHSEALTLNFKAKEPTIDSTAYSEPLIITELSKTQILYVGHFKGESFTSATDIQSKLFINELKNEFSLMIKESINE